MPTTLLRAPPDFQTLRRPCSYICKKKVRLNIEAPNLSSTYLVGINKLQNNPQKQKKQHKETKKKLHKTWYVVLHA